jgi:hypothetical protein
MSSIIDSGFLRTEHYLRHAKLPRAISARRSKQYWPRTCYSNEGFELPLFIILIITTATINNTIQLTFFSLFVFVIGVLGAGRSVAESPSMPRCPLAI